VPFVRIDLQKGKDAAYRAQISSVVHEALVSVGVPKDDRFQVISEYEPPNLVFDPSFLGIRRSEEMVIVQITWNEGRTLEQKKALYKAIADGLAGKLGLRREDVFVNLVEVKLVVRQRACARRGIQILPNPAKSSQARPK
jgi:4-oxalocrotonate tautomerase